MFVPMYVAVITHNHNRIDKDLASAGLIKIDRRKDRLQRALKKADRAKPHQGGQSQKPDSLTALIRIWTTNIFPVVAWSQRQISSLRWDPRGLGRREKLGLLRMETALLLKRGPPHTRHCLMNIGMNHHHLATSSPHIQPTFRL